MVELRRALAEQYPWLIASDQCGAPAHDTDPPLYCNQPKGHPGDHTAVDDNDRWGDGRSVCYRWAPGFWDRHANTAPGQGGSSRG